MIQPKLTQRPAPMATGVLARKPLAHLLVYVFDGKMTGSFELVDEANDETVWIVVESGMISRVSTRKPTAYLGHVLYEMGFIDDTQLNQSLAVIAATHRLHGQVLLGNGTINRTQLAEALRLQRSRKLHRAFELPPETAFAFFAGVDGVGRRPNDVEPMDPLASIWRGILERPAWDHVRSTLATVGGQPLRLVGTIEGLRLEDGAAEAIERLRRGQATTAQLAAMPRLDARAAQLLSYFLVITKLAEVASDRGPSKPVSVPAPVSPTSAVNKTTHRSGEHVRTPSFTMRGVSSDKTALRIPSPFPRPGSPISASRLKVSVSSPARDGVTSSPRVGMPTKANLEAEHALSQAEMHLVLGDRDPAVSFAKRALSIEPEMPDARALLAYLGALALDSGQEAQLRDSLSRIDAALREKDTCRRGHYYRAAIRSRLEDHEGAISDLREALLQDPNDVEALAELRDYEQQLKDGTVTYGPKSSGASRTRSGGLLGLFGRTKD